VVRRFEAGRITSNLMIACYSSPGACGDMGL
jgi:hypothetical protein